MGRDKPMQIKAKESKQFFWYNPQGVFYTDESYECTRMIDTIEMSIRKNKILTKDIMNPDNWIHQRKDGRNAKEICTFRITNQDLKH